MSFEAPTGPLDGPFIDLIQPFMVDETHVHGRFVRLHEVVNTILHRHNYPAAVSQLLAEQLVLTALLSRSLKHEGIITLQVQGDGPVRLMVTDVNSKGELRGYADLAEGAAKTLARTTKKPRKLTSLFGKGYMAITLDRGANTHPYQGIVELEGTNMTDCCLKYLHQSEQFTVHIKTAVEERDGGWAAGGLLVQRLPDPEGEQLHILPEPEEDVANENDPEEAEWEQTTIFVNSLKPDEILDPELEPSRLLFRLFHGEGVWIYERGALSVGCRCSRDRIQRLLMSLSQEELASLAEDDVITVTCQFCTKDEVFEASHLIANDRGH